MLAAIMFYLDITIVNTDSIHYQAWHQMLSSYDTEAVLVQGVSKISD
ncbi:hypothetical protein [Dendronalium sp. ChiSLP03b]